MDVSPSSSQQKQLWAFARPETRLGKRLTGEQLLAKPLYLVPLSLATMNTCTHMQHTACHTCPDGEHNEELLTAVICVNLTRSQQNFLNVLYLAVTKE